MSKYDPAKHHRRSIRLKGYDYAQSGFYFITICVQNRACLFGKIRDGEMILNDAGQMVEQEWLKLPDRFSNIELHEFVVMPNHFHAILEITVGATLVVAPVVVAPVVVAPVVVAPVVVAPVVVAPVVVAPVVVAPVVVAPVVVAPVVVAPVVVAPIDDGQPQGLPVPPPKPKTVGDMVGAFQSIVTVEYIRGVKNNGWPHFDRKLWQRNYWEYIIRSEDSFHVISGYIKSNPSKWADDKFFEP